MSGLDPVSRRLSDAAGSAAAGSAVGGSAVGGSAAAGSAVAGSAGGRECSRLARGRSAGDRHPAGHRRRAALLTAALLTATLVTGARVIRVGVHGDGYRDDHRRRARASGRRGAGVGRGRWGVGRRRRGHGNGPDRCAPNADGPDRAVARIGRRKRRRWRRRHGRRWRRAGSLRCNRTDTRVRCHDGRFLLLRTHAINEHQAKPGDHHDPRDRGQCHQGVRSPRSWLRVDLRGRVVLEFRGLGQRSVFVRRVAQRARRPRLADCQVVVRGRGDGQVLVRAGGDCQVLVRVAAKVADWKSSCGVAAKVVDWKSSMVLMVFLNCGRSPRWAAVTGRSSRPRWLGHFFRNFFQTPRPTRRIRPWRSPPARRHRSPRRRPARRIRSWWPGFRRR